MKKCPFSQGIYCTEDCMLYNAEKKLCNMGNYDNKIANFEVRINRLEEDVRSLQAAQEITTSSKKKSIK